MIERTKRIILLCCSFSFVSVTPLAAHDYICEAGDAVFEEGYLSLYLDGRYVTEVLVRLSRGGVVEELRYRDVFCLLDDDEHRWLMGIMADAQDYRGWVPMEALVPLNPTFDSDNLTLCLTTPAAQRDSRVIDYTAYPVRELSKAVKPATLSAFLNIRPLYSYADEASEYVLDTDGAVRWHDWVAEGRFDLHSEHDPLFGFQDTRLVRDFPDRCQRLSIGEDQSFRPRMLSADRIYGLKLSSDFNLQPFLVTEPISEYSFILENDATVEIWVNGDWQDLLRLDAGPYDIRQLPLTSGFNEVTIKIRDDLGQEEVLTFYSVKGPNLLGVGQRDFAISAGAIGSGRDVHGPGVISAFYRFGLAKYLTVSAEGRLSPEHQAVSFGANGASRYCFWNADVAAASHRDGDGLAMRIGVGKRFSCFQATFRFDLQEKGYLNQYQSKGSERLRMSEKFLVTARLPDKWGNVHFTAANVNRWKGDPTRQLELAWTARFWDKWNIDVRGRYSEEDNPKSELRTTITYQIVGEKINRSHSLRTAATGPTLRSTVSNRHPEVDGCNWRLTHYREYPSKSTEHVDTLNGTIRRQDNRSRLYASLWVDEFARKNEYRYDLNLGSSLVYADGVFAVGPPIDDSFALVRVDPSLGDIPIEASAGGYRHWVSSGRMAAVVPTLQGYHPANIQVSLEGQGVDLANDQLLVMPTYKSGIVLEPGLDDEYGGLFVARGRLIDEDGRPVDLKSVLVTNLDKPQTPSFFTFTNRAGVFETTGMGSGDRYRLQVLEEEPIWYEFSFPELTTLENVVNLGDLSPCFTSETP